MRTTSRSLLSFAVLLACNGLWAQGDGKPPQKPDPAVAKLLDELKDAVLDRKVEHDADGIKVIDQLAGKVRDGSMIEKDQESFAKGLEAVFTKGKVREPDKIQLYVAAGYALGLLGEKGVKPLMDAYKSSRFPDKPEWVRLREDLLKDLGKTKTKDGKAIKFLMDEARRAPEPPLMAAAGEALGNFDGADQKIRKDIVNNLLIRYGEVDSLARVLDPANIEAQNARDRRAAISDKWNTTLGKMTGQDFRSYPEWNGWYQKNKNSDWK